MFDSSVLKKSIALDEDDIDSTTLPVLDPLFM
jgi:hypothetical protein